jgi:hypothetical protein
MKYVQGFSKVQAIRRIQDVKTLPYLPRMLDVEITTYQVANAAREFAESSPKFALPQKAKKTGGKIGKVDYGISSFVSGSLGRRGISCKRSIELLWSSVATSPKLSQMPYWMISH